MRPHSDQNRQARGRSLALAALVLITSGSALTAGFVWDDEVLVSHNARFEGEGAWQRALTDDFWATSAPNDAARGYWRPLVKLSHLALWKLGDHAAWPFHLFNLALHLACVLLVDRWLRARLPDAHPLATWLGAALFAVHLTRFEVVPWASCATDLLMTCFALLALWALERERWVLGAVLVALGLLSKESIVLLPVVLAVDGWLRARWQPRALVATTLGLAVPWLTRLALHLAAPPIRFDGPLAALTRATSALGFYAWRTVAPWPATVLLSEPNSDDFSRLLPVGVLTAVALAGFLFAVWRKPALRPLLADLAWWLLLLAPFLQVLPLPATLFASDRFVYLPLLGVCALVARLATTRAAHLAVGGFVAASALSLALAVPAWESGLTFFARERRLHPESGFVASALAGQLERAGQNHACQALLFTVARQQPPRYGAWAIGQLAHLTLAVTTDDRSPALPPLVDFYDGLALNPPRPLVVDGETFTLRDPELARRQAERGQWDDVQLFRATLALRLGDLDGALARARALQAAPTFRRELLLARVLAARDEAPAAVELVRRSRFGGWQHAPAREALETLAHLHPLPACDAPCAGAEREAWRQALGAWATLDLQAREQDGLARVDDLRLRAWSLARRGDDDGALAAARALGDAAFSETLEGELTRRREAIARELETVAP